MFCFMCFGARHARQRILLIKEMIFEYLMIILAQKAEILEKVENSPNFKNSPKSGSLLMWGGEEGHWENQSGPSKNP